MESKLQGVVEAVKRAADQEEREDEEREARRLAVEKAKWDQLQDDHRNSLAEVTAKVAADQATLAQLHVDAVAEDLATARLRLNFGSDSRRSDEHASLQHFRMCRCDEILGLVDAGRLRIV